MIGFQFWDIKVKLFHNINFIGLQKPYWSVTKNWKYHKIAFSLNKVFPGSATRYCYFHYTQSLKRQLSEKGVQAREETNLAIGQFRYLYTAARLSAYVPPQDVRQWFEQVKKYTWNKSNTRLHRPLGAIFEWFGKFPYMYGNLQNHSKMAPGGVRRRVCKSVMKSQCFLKL